MSERKLPSHIADALAASGGATDSADRPWAGRDLSSTGETVHQFGNDDGASDPEYVRTLEALNAGRGTEADVVAQLATVRLFVPIVAEVAAAAPEADSPVDDKESDMAMVSLRAPDGRKALPVFSNVADLERWHPQARPVAVVAPRAALSAAAEDAQLMVVDPGGAQTFVVRRPAAWSLAQQLRWTPSYLNDQVQQAVRRAVEDLQAVTAAGVTAGSGVASSLGDGRTVHGGGPGPELRINVTLIPGLDERQVQSVVSEMQTRLAADQEFVDLVDSLEIKLAASVPEH
ncbi:SseB family protein [Arthrobacter castelli]|uniref:SseB family protein n=1 Tax=Arthrobacter castelli TaxID=271431 RepID=UPI00055FBB0B